MSRCFCCYKPVKSNVGQLYCPSNKASKTFRYLLTDPLSKIAQIWEQTFPAIPLARGRPEITRSNQC
jgi:hypothetical protein